MTIGSTQSSPTANSTVTRNVGPSPEELALGRQRFAALLGIELPGAEAQTAASVPGAETNGRAETYEVSTNGTSIQISKRGAPAAQAAPAGPLPTRTLPVTPDAAQFAFDPIALLQDRLRSRGIDFSGIRFEQVEQANMSPGATPLTFHYVRAHFPNGQTENFATEWVLYNPDVTATEIGQFLKSSESA